MSNRVEDLETQVAELEATIEGLTDELVETKERVHELERQAAEQLDIDVPEVEEEPQTTAEQQAEARGTDERRDAQFVENAPATEEPPEETAEPEEADDDDDEIIVA